MANVKKPDGWTDQHEAELRALAARGEDARSIIELMGTDYPDLRGKLNLEWVKQKVRDGNISG